MGLGWESTSGPVCAPRSKGFIFFTFLATASLSYYVLFAIFIAPPVSRDLTPMVSVYETKSLPLHPYLTTAFNPSGLPALEVVCPSENEEILDYSDDDDLPSVRQILACKEGRSGRRGPQGR